MSRVTGVEYKNRQNVTKSLKITQKIEISSYTVARAVAFARAAVVDSFGVQFKYDFSGLDNSKLFKFLRCIHSCSYLEISWCLPTKVRKFWGCHGLPRPSTKTDFRTFGSQVTGRYELNKMLQYPELNVFERPSSRRAVSHRAQNLFVFAAYSIPLPRHVELILHAYGRACSITYVQFVRPFLAFSV
jgi:hypothetical protein